MVDELWKPSAPGRSGWAGRWAEVCQDRSLQLFVCPRSVWVDAIQLCDPTARQMQGMNILKIPVKSSKISRWHEGSFSPKIRGSWGWAFNHACCCYCGQQVVKTVRVKKHEVLEITKAGNKRRLSLWRTAILEAPGISGLWRSQQFQSRQDSPLVSMVVISQFDRGPKARTSPAVSLLQSRHWGRLAALGRDVFLPLRCPRKWNDFRDRRREVSPAWSRRDTFPRLCT